MYLLPAFISFEEPSSSHVKTSLSRQGPGQISSLLPVIMNNIIWRLENRGGQPEVAEITDEDIRGREVTEDQSEAGMEASGQSEASIVSRLWTPIVFQTLVPVINRYSKHKQWQQFLWNILGKWNNVARSTGKNIIFLAHSGFALNHSNSAAPFISRA